MKDIVSLTFDLDEVELKCIKIMESTNKRNETAGTAPGSYTLDKEVCGEYMRMKISQKDVEIRERRSQLDQKKLLLAKEMAEDPKLKDLFEFLETAD